MTTFVLGTTDVDTSATLCDYLQGRVDGGDTVHAINSLRGGRATGDSLIRNGEDALNVVQSRLGGTATVETHQFVRGNDPATDLLELADDVGADELVFGIRKRSPTAKVVFGSTAQEVLLNADIPMAVVPLEPLSEQ